MTDSEAVSHSPPTLPQCFSSYDEYLSFLDDVAEYEIEAMLNCGYDPNAMGVPGVREWLMDTPTLTRSDSIEEWWRLYHDVREYADVPFPQTDVTIPDDDVFPELAELTEHVVREDAFCRTQELLEDRGYEL